MISIRKLNNPSSYQMQFPSELSLSREWKLELVQIFSKESSEKVKKGRECEEWGKGKILKFPVRRIPSVQEAYRSSGNHLDRQKPVLRLCTSSKDPLSRFRGTGANQPLEIDFFSQRVHPYSGRRLRSAGALVYTKRSPSPPPQGSRWN